MDFLLNDLSLSGQFQDISAFRNAITRLFEIRTEIQRRGSAVYCHRKLADAQITATTVMKQAIQLLPHAQRLSLIQWLTKLGPYWEDVRMHGPDDWIEVNGTIVTDSAIGEAAVCRIHGLNRELISIIPSNWDYSPIDAIFVRDSSESCPASIPNHRRIETVKACLEANPERTDSWRRLGIQMVRECTSLTFATNAFEYLHGHPFVPGAAERIRVLLLTLDNFKKCFDKQGQRTVEGHSLYADHFMGDKAWFSDSSDAEKVEFEREMKFPYPPDPTQDLFCTWHGKVKAPQIRIHFSWPVRSDVPLFVMYVGPKITKR